MTQSDQQLTQDMHQYYATRAPYYDAVYDKPERQADIAFLRQHLPARLGGKSVLEIACGTGYWTQHIAPVCARMVATDGTAEPLEFAKLRPGTGHVQFFQMDAYAPDPQLGHFEAAFAGLWLSHVPRARLAQFFQGLHARLLPGSRVLLIDNAEVQCTDYPIIETDADGNTYQNRPTRDGGTHRVLKNFPTEAQLHAMVGAGATNMAYQALDNFWLFEYELHQPTKAERASAWFKIT